jgi:colanic acid biosynthesis glycosyl transferase WcaI
LRVLLYTANFPPEQVGIGKYSGEMCAWLHKQGHEVRVVTALPYYPEWSVAEAYRGKGYLREAWSGCEVWRAPHWVPAKLSGLTRVLHLASFAIASAPLALRQLAWRPDVVLAVAPAIFCAPTAWLTARLCGAKAWLHVQDFEVDVGFRLRMVRGNLVQRALLALERWLLRRFDRVSTISQSMVELARGKGVRAERLVHFPNWVDVDAIRPDAGKAQGLRAELGIAPDAVVALYSGSLGAKHGLKLLPELARTLQGSPEIHTVICGDGAMKEQLMQAGQGLARLHFLPLQPTKRLGELLAMADIHLLTQSAGAQDLVLPSKLGGMLASGRPVIATCNRDTEIARMVDSCGIVVPPDDVVALAGAVKRLAMDAELRQRLGANARIKAMEHLSARKVLGCFHAELLRVVNGPLPDQQQASLPLTAPGSTAQKQFNGRSK